MSRGRRSRPPIRPGSSNVDPGSDGGRSRSGSRRDSSSAASENGARSTSVSSSTGTSSSDSEVDEAMVRHQTRLGRIHRLRVRLVEAENRALERVLGYQNVVLERILERSNVLRDASAYRQAQLEAMRAIHMNGPTTVAVAVAAAGAEAADDDDDSDYVDPAGTDGGSDATV